MLIGINNDWSYQIAPVGIVCIDNLGPSIGSSFSNNLDSNEAEFIFSEQRIKVVSQVSPPITTGSVTVWFGDFQGYGYMLSVPFTFYYFGDVKTIVVHRTKTMIEEIDLSDKVSPYHITLQIGLNTGDNYIPIDAIDACGNKNTYDLKITTERIKDDNPRLNIENNIYN